MNRQINNKGHLWWAVPMCPMLLCAHFSPVWSVHLCSMFLYVRCYSVPTVPLCPVFLWVHCSFCPLFLCSYRYSVLNVPLLLLFVWAHCSSVATLLSYVYCNDVSQVVVNEPWALMVIILVRRTPDGGTQVRALARVRRCGQETLPSLSMQVYKWVTETCWGSLTECWRVTWDGIASRPANGGRNIPNGFSDLYYINRRSNRSKRYEPVIMETAIYIH